MPELEDFSGIDLGVWRTLAENIGLPQLQRFAQEYCVGLEDEISRFPELAAEPQRLVRKAHQYAGSGSTMGFMKIRSLLIEIEENPAMQQGEALQNQCGLLIQEVACAHAFSRR
ncbi:MAG: Hpt domain-containing protein [Candidatus Protistobacter heckmanni]|nr:Hpt domain-containing protein [Candidatus Protistobacter heckmanni]